ncbi:MAG: DUF6076 domain-containing protein [Clostridia bacterium]|nr:DUF6076 domain-containing protein [Clostridia bacterium]
MKKVDFDKNIKIYSIANNHYQGLSLKSILYTPIPYRIPVAFADATNSIDDTEKYIKDTYSKEEQEAIAYNNKINTEFWNELLKLKNPSEKETINLSKIYQEKLNNFKYTAPDELRNITPNDNIDKMTGYFVIDSNALINKNGELLIEFLNLDFDRFNDFVIFFTKYFGMFINLFDDLDIKNIEIDELTDLKTIITLAKKVYPLEKKKIIDMQKLLISFVTLLYGYNNDNEINSLTLQQKFYVFYDEHKKELDKFSTNFQHCGSFNFEYSQIYANDLKHKNSSELIKKIKKIDESGNKISSNNYILTQNIYTVFYISLYNLVVNNNEFIRQCKNCHRYFLTSKSNTFFCENIYYEGKKCREVGNQLQQKRKENENPVYKKYRNTFANKATLLKRNPDIYSKEDYENWKEAAQNFKKDIKKGIRTEEEFDKWLDKNK